MCTGAFRSQRKSLGPSELALQVVVSFLISLLRKEVSLSGRAQRLPTHSHFFSLRCNIFSFFFQVFSMCVVWTHECRTHRHGRLSAYHNITTMCPALESSMAILWPDFSLVIWSLILIPGFTSPSFPATEPSPHWPYLFFPLFLSSCAVFHSRLLCHLSQFHKLNYDIYGYLARTKT